MSKYKRFQAMLVFATLISNSGVEAHSGGGHGGGGHFGGGHFGGHHFGGGHFGGHHFGGRYFGGYYGGYPGFGFSWGYPWYYGSYYPYYPYAYPYYSPQVVTVPTAPQVYIERSVPQSSQQLPSGYWYYCSGPKGYYPYVKHCPSGWRQVEPVPPPSK